MIGFGRARRHVGIVFEGRFARASLVRQGRRRPLASAHAPLPPDVWARDDAAFSDVFAALAKALGPAARRADVGVTIALPDPLVLEEVVSFRAVPEDPKAAAELIRWRSARDHRKAPEDIVCTSAPAGRDDDGQRLRVRVLPAPRVACITAAAAAVGFRVDRMEALAALMPAGPGVEVRISPDWWSVRAAEGPPTALRHHADWCDVDAMPETLRRVIRVLRAIALQGGQTPLPVRLFAAKAVTRALTTALANGAIALEPQEPGDPETLSVEIAAA